MIKKVETFKSGHFVFSSDYDKEKIDAYMLKAKLLYHTIATIPLLPEIAAKLESEFIIKCIFGSAAIEGNPLTEKRVGEILEGNQEESKKEAEQQIINLKKTYLIIKLMSETNQNVLIKENLIKEIHKEVTFNTDKKDNRPGCYRNHSSYVGNANHGGTYKPPKIFKDIQNLMGHFIEWINSKEILEEDPVIRAALAHYHIALIHPFGNGNGRTSRAVEAVIMKCSDIKFVWNVLPNFYYSNIDDYYWAFSKSERNKEHNVTPFLEFFSKSLIASLTDVQNKIYAWVRRLALKEYYHSLKRDKKISGRQFDLLSLLLEYPETFTINELLGKIKYHILYRTVSQLTVRRDINLLLKQNILIKNKENKFELHINLLG